MPAKSIDLSRVARLRASGCSWVAIAKEVGVHESTISRRTKEHSATWAGLLADAEFAIARECSAEAVMLLRTELRADAGKDRRDAAAKLLRYAISKIRPTNRPAEATGNPGITKELQEALDFIATLKPEDLDAFIRTLDSNGPVEIGVSWKSTDPLPAENRGV